MNRVNAQHSAQRPARQARPTQYELYPSVMTTMLSREEYIEQAYFFRAFSERFEETASQDLLAAIREEILTTTKLPMAIDYMLAELKHQGAFGPAMAKLPHYFTPFQTYVIGEAENERGKFDLRVALEILRREAEYRAQEPSPEAVFLYQFEALCRNRLGYDHGLQAVAADPIFDETWREWIRTIRHQIGMIDIADLIYVRSEYYHEVQARQRKDDRRSDRPPLFGLREGRIALANRRKEPLLLFNALHRQLGYPEIPRPKPVDESTRLLPLLVRKVDRLEQRIKLLEEEQRGGIDLDRFVKKPQQ